MWALYCHYTVSSNLSNKFITQSVKTKNMTDKTRVGLNLFNVPNKIFTDLTPNRVYIYGVTLCLMSTEQEKIR